MPYKATIGPIAVFKRGEFSASVMARYCVRWRYFARPKIRVTFCSLSARARPEVGRVMAKNFASLRRIVGKCVHRAEQQANDLRVIAIEGFDLSISGAG